MVHALVPVKHLAQAKSRLSDLLDPPERRALNQAMLEDVLEVLSGHSAIDQIVLVSDDPAVGLTADQYQTAWLSGRHGAGEPLNEALTVACDHIARETADAFLIVHSDMPVLQSEDLDALFTAFRRPATYLVLAPDSRSDGTNAMLCPIAARPAFSYGAQSFSKHMDDAQSRNLSYAVVRRPGIAQDVDLPADLLAVFRTRACTPCGRHTAAFLAQPAIEDRLYAFLETASAPRANRSVAVNE